MTRLIPLLALLSAAPLLAQTLPSDLDRTVEHAMRTFAVPGAAVSVVHDGRTLLARGYGVRHLHGAAPVDERTLFGIGSNTKGMTAVLLAMLVDEGTLAWDDRVSDHLPGFALADTGATARLTVRDLLAHRSGLGTGAGDLLAFPATTYGRDEVLRRMRFLPLAGGLRSGFRYNDLNYLAAGAVVEAITGRSWEDNLRTRILAPLGIEGSTSGSDYDPHGNWAAPHASIGGEPHPVAPAVFDNAAPAGSVNASAADLARWMSVLLDSGRVGGRRLWSAARTRDLWSPHTAIPLGEPPPELPGWRTSRLAYGLGFLLREYRGASLVYHAGEVPGYHSHLYLVPDRGIGVAVLTNAETPASHAIAMTVVDALMGAPPSDWTAGMQAVVARGAAVPDTAPEAVRESTLPYPAYAHRYADSWYGEVEVMNEGRGLVMRFTHSPGMVGDMDHWSGDTFRVRWRDPAIPEAFASFEVVGRSVRTLRMRTVSPRAHFRYDFHDLVLVPVR